MYCFCCFLCKQFVKIYSYNSGKKMKSINSRKPKHRIPLQSFLGRGVDLKACKFSLKLCKTRCLDKDTAPFNPNHNCFRKKITGERRCNKRAKKLVKMITMKLKKKWLLDNLFLRGVVQWITKKLQCLDDKMDRNNQKKMDRNRLWYHM